MFHYSPASSSSISPLADPQSGRHLGSDEKAAITGLITLGSDEKRKKERKKVGNLGDNIIVGQTI